jgi:hypothetical protein
MKSGHLKGALLEYLVRRLLSNCGFTSVKADGHYVYEQVGLFFINGKGAAHDADVLMEPPIQMPFSYPSRILFECKAYDQVGLPFVRNALGLRYDINEFEIITDTSIQQRKNNRRADYAISDRKRFNYQVGVATVGDFSKPAIEFAANNKITLLSLKWFMRETCELIHTIDESYLNEIGAKFQDKIYAYLKDKKQDAEYADRNNDARTFIQKDKLIGEIIRSFNTVINGCYVGLIETGDLIFLFADQPDSFELLNHEISFNGLRAQIHYYGEEPDVWLLEIISFESYRNKNPKFKFFVPERIMNIWKKFSLDRTVAIDLKRDFFSRIFIFSKPRNSDLPFFVVNIDRKWLDRIRDN